ncbi:hypothetical protein [Rickettsia endosymbiont of Orchestes rusci]
MPRSAQMLAMTFKVFFKSTVVSYRGLTHYCTNVEKRLCHAVT